MLIILGIKGLQFLLNLMVSRKAGKGHPQRRFFKGLRFGDFPREYPLGDGPIPIEPHPNLRGRMDSLSTVRTFPIIRIFENQFGFPLLPFPPPLFPSHDKEGLSFEF